MPKLSDTQLMLLSSATQRDGIVVLPAKLKGGAATKVVKPLLAHGLVNEVPSKPDMPAWRRDETEGQSYALVITRAGRKAINVEDDGEQPDQPAEKPARKSRRATKPAGRKGANRRRKSRSRAKAGGSANRRSKSSGSLAEPRAGSKLALVVKMLERPRGATADDLTAATSWLPHTARAVITSLRNRGYRVETERNRDHKMIYRIAAGKGSGRDSA